MILRYKWRKEWPLKCVKYDRTCGKQKSSMCLLVPQKDRGPSGGQRRHDDDKFEVEGHETRFVKSVSDQTGLAGFERGVYIKNASRRKKGQVWREPHERRFSDSIWRGEVRRNRVGSDETGGIREGYMYLILPSKDKGSSVRGDVR